MKAAAVTAEQIRAIHAIKTRTRLEEGSYRGMLQGFGVSTSKDLSRADADRLLRRMRDIPGAEKPASRVKKAKADGPYAAKMQAMWIALWNLGAVEDGRDSALHAFCKRQTGLDHSRFLRSAADASSVIQALKDWLIRSGVTWPAITGDPGLDRLAVKREIIRAQWRRGMALGVLRQLDGVEEDLAMTSYVSTVARGGARMLGNLSCPSVTPEELDKASTALGRKIRGAQVNTAAERPRLAGGA
ncbi:regulatory protein GemA [Methylorubrum extorquens]|uniref:regulatory protein GemA n=1 Tax=Methylorubrum extorquens TaxID=408 RepID=UPI003F61F436